MIDKDIDNLFSKAKNIYIVGIKGAGVSGLAQILKSKGYNITGSDTEEKFFTDTLLKKSGIKYNEGFSEKNITDDIDLAISSNAYLSDSPTNPEIVEIKRRNIPLLSYPEALSYIFNNSFGVAVAGTHGKTTTTAALAFMLHKAGLKPNALIGAESANLGSNVISGESDIFILEADEYKNAFLNYKPQIILILNTDWDHPDYFKSHNEYLDAFEKFKNNIKPKGKIFTPEDFTKIELPASPKVIGEHNKYDLKAAYLIAKYLGADEEKLKEAIQEFRGTNRRLEIIGEWNGNIVIDDYGHNPQKVEAGLKALKKHYPEKELIVIFQPHTYSRTEQFLKELAKALTFADKIYLLDIYASAREAKGTITSDDIVNEIKKLGRESENLNTLSNAEKYFKNNPPSNSVIVAMGAGDVGDLAHKLIKAN